MKLRTNKAGNGYVSNYTPSISLNEARAGTLKAPVKLRDKMR